MSGHLNLLMGIPGSGKSTFVATHMADDDVLVSRDQIRFSMIGEKDEYFSKEDEVFNTFIKQINKGLSKGKTVWADATHLSPNSRAKTLRRVLKNADSVDCIWVRAPLKTALKQNEKRKGTRAYVPVSVIRRMNSQMIAPEYHEGFSTIYIVEPNRPIVINEKG